MKKAKRKSAKPSDVQSVRISDEKWNIAMSLAKSNNMAAGRLAGIAVEWLLALPLELQHSILNTIPDSLSDIVANAFDDKARELRQRHEKMILSDARDPLATESPVPPTLPPKSGDEPLEPAS